MKAFVIASVRPCLGALVLAACSFGTMEGELPPNEDGGRSGVGGSGVVGSGRATGGNGLTRPESAGGQPSGATSSGIAGGPSVEESGAGYAGVPDPALGGSPGLETGGDVPGSSVSGGVGDGAGGTLGAAGEAAESAGSGGADTEPVIPPIPEIFFSEYVEGSSNNKALEVSARVDGSLDGCSIRVYLNGSVSPSATVPLSGPIVMSTAFVLCDSGFSEAARCNQQKALRFNGNDRVELECRGELLDVIGQAGEAPEERWGTPELGTLDQTLRRQCAIQTGDRDASDPFDPALEWVSAGKDAFEDLGIHCAVGSP